MRYKIALVFLVFVFFVAVGIEGAETADFIPESCIAVVSISSAQKDPGISWLINAWINSPRESPLRDFLNETAVREFSVAVFPTTGDSSLNLLLVMNFPEKVKFDKERLDKIVMPEDDTNLESLSYKGYDIIYSTPGDFEEDFTAYTIIKNQVLAGSEVDVVKKAIDGPSVKKNSSYQRVRSQFSGGGDGLLFADNGSARFVDFLQPLEEKWKMTLLLSAEYLAWMGASFDIIDSNKVGGKFVFQGVDTTYIEDIQDDADFLGEAFKRKFMAEKINYTKNIDVTGKTVVLNMTIEGIEPLWLKLFEGGVLSLIRPE